MDNMAATRKALSATLRLWQQGQNNRDNLGEAKRGTRKKYKGKDKVDRLGYKYLRRVKLINAYVKNGMADRDFRRLPLDLQIAIWEEASERISNLIRDALGTTYRHLIKRCAPGDGIGCYRAMLLLENVQTAGARNRFLSQLMALKLQHTGDAKNAASMLTYYNKLIEINEKYGRTGRQTDYTRKIPF